jgi:threonine/homoserine/homoserine lactone efflux protein
VSTGAADSSYLAFVTFTFILVVTPGSTTAVVVRNALEGGRRAGYLTALGAAVANSIIAIACGLGLSILIAVWPGSLDAIRIGGALFLGWLGAASLYRAATRPDGGINLVLDANDEPPSFDKLRTAPSAVEGPRTHGGAYLGDGLAINLLSPVIISFYLSVVPSFIPAGASRFYYSGLAATHVGLALACHAMWATALGLMRRWFVAPWTRRVLQSATGLALIGLAIKVIA